MQKRKVDFIDVLLDVNTFGFNFPKLICSCYFASARWTSNDHLFAVVSNQVAPPRLLRSAQCGVPRICHTGDTTKLSRASRGKENSRRHLPSWCSARTQLGFFWPASGGILVSNFHKSAESSVESFFNGSQGNSGRIRKNREFFMCDRADDLNRLLQVTSSKAAMN